MSRRKSSLYQQIVCLQVYNYQTHRCCQDTVVEKIYGRYSRCCGDSVVNSKSYYCCNRTTPYHRTTHICCGGEIRDRVFGSYSRCCKTVVYNYRESRCCNGALHCKPTSSKNIYCCGSKTYDPSDQICCRDCPGIVRKIGTPGTPGAPLLPDTPGSDDDDSD